MIDSNIVEQELNNLGYKYPIFEIEKWGTKPNECNLIIQFEGKLQSSIYNPEPNKWYWDLHEYGNDSPLIFNWCDTLEDAIKRMYEWKENEL